MITRSETKYEMNAKYAVDIDFDGASEAWKTNKILQGNRTYRYCCMAIDKERCCRKIVSPYEYCRRHIYLTVKNT
jgi:hypothetical protein